jgi:hypothetical protein
MPVANTLAYYETITITKLKVANLVKKFRVKFTHTLYKLEPFKVIREMSLQ